ncbi:dof zinc finger protein DOF4.6-like isoform X2 [Cynara cardunculus var. scolymus]|uniref:dof zinc finger protein DOF4.6-like isoform X2 n=1 Tax=Cynara cardunculus var. scolymus TaxID=59895 RepID=UPI000D62B49C|nr:dof zinc finger protein DOF4.6-like isoform X2 [Cynara cardunculus var. scolymus]
MDAAQWSEGLGMVKSMEEKKTIRAQKPQALNCPRRYWTEGGSLRNVPVGGGSRRNKRSSSSSSSSVPPPAAAAASISKNQHQMMMGPPIPSLIAQNPSKTIIQNHGGQGQGHGQDLNLGYTNVSLQFGNLPYNPNTTTTSSSSQFSAMDFLKSGFADPRQVMMNSLPNTMIMNSPAGLNFSLDGFENGGGYHHHHHQHHHLQGGGGVTNHQGTMSTITTTAGTSENARILFPFEDLKPISTTNSELLEATRGQGESSSGYWGGGLGGGSW